MKTRWEATYPHRIGHFKSEMLYFKTNSKWLMEAAQLIGDTWCGVDDLFLKGELKYLMLFSFSLI